MKLIIDIPEDIYTSIKNGMRYKDDVKYVMDKIEQCTPIPDNATNGDIIKTLFPQEGDFETDFDTDWWNAPYKRGDTE